MPTTVLDLDARSLPASIRLPDGHDRAMALIRWRAYPVGCAYLDVPGGVIGGDALRDALDVATTTRIAERRATEWLGYDAHAPAHAPEHAPAAVRATIAICTRDRLDDLARCLVAMDALPDDGQEVLVIDNASRDGDAVQALVAGHRRARCVREERAGLDIARNRALADATGEIVLFCDDDAVVDPHWLRAIARNFVDARTMCVTGLTMPLELESEAQEWFERTNAFGRGFRRVVHDGAVHDAFFISRVGAGVNMAVRRSVTTLVGPFDELLDAGTPTKSGGDHDMFTRIMLAGYCIVYDPAALSWHRHRREWRELQDAVRGYGTGVWAYLTAQLLQGEPRALVVAMAWLRWQVRELLRAILLRPPELRVDLAVSELRGCLAGPAAYFRSRRARASAGPR